MGIFRRVTVTCRYQRTSAISKSEFENELYHALGQVVASQPMLQVSILDEDSNAAKFGHLHEINIHDHVAFKDLNCKTSEEYGAALLEENEACLATLFPDVASQSPWRITVLKPSDSAVAPSLNFYDVMFSFHHSLMDGTSGRRFHELLLQALNSPGKLQEGASSNHILSFPEGQKLPESQEDAIPFTNSISFVVQAFWNELAPSALKPRRDIPWHGKPTDYKLPNKVHVRAIDVVPKDVDKLLVACRQHSTSLTGLVHAFALVSFSRHLSEAEGVTFACSTPINLRPWFGPSADPNHKELLRCLITSHTHSLEGELVREVRASGNEDLTDVIWKIARRMKSEISAKTVSLPHNDVGGLIKYIGDWFGMWKRKEGGPRSDSWEVSNIGKLVNKSDQPAEWSVSRVLFSNPAMVTGPAVGINVASVEGGALTATISWQDTIVPDELGDTIRRDFIAFVKCFSECGKFTHEK